MEKSHHKSNAVSLHRVIKAKPEKVFKAFSDPLANSYWFPPHGFLCTVQEMDFKVGGTFKMTFINFSTGKGQSFGGEYLEIKASELIKYIDRFDDPNLPGEMTTTIRLKEVMVGSELMVLQENIPEVIPVEFCYLGWQECLDKLIKLVEPDIPDA